MANRSMIELMLPRMAAFRAQAEGLKKIDHNWIKGRLREILLSQIIEPFLPPSVAALTGTIVSEDGRRREARNQDDIVLFSRERAPVLLELGEQCVMPVGGVMMHVEVKSTLTAGDIRDAVAAACELSEMSSGTAPGAIIFGLTSDAEKKSEAERLLDVLRDEKVVPRPGQATSPIQCICVADRGLWTLSEANGRSGWWFVPIEEERHLLTLVSLVSNTMYREFGTSAGVGSHLLDVGWLQGPDPECERVVPSATVMAFRAIKNAVDQSQSSATNARLGALELLSRIEWQLSRPRLDEGVMAALFQSLKVRISEMGDRDVEAVLVAAVGDGS